MRAYGLPLREIMAMPVKTFWTVSGSVPRLMATENREQLRLLMVTAAGTEGEAATDLFKTLSEATPEPITLTAKAIVQAGATRDEDGFNELRSMAS